MSATLKPEDLLEPWNFPDDLKCVPAHYKLHPTDPVYLLIAWHWWRVKQSEDTLKAAIVENEPSPGQARACPGVVYGHDGYTT